MKRLISILIAVIILTPIAIIGNIPVGFVPKEESSPSRELMPVQLNQWLVGKLSMMLKKRGLSKLYFSPCSLYCTLSL